MFSATVIQSIRPRSWWMKAIGRRRSELVTSRPRKVTLPSSSVVDARQDLDQRRLAGAVLAEKREDLAGFQRKADRDRAPACRRTAWISRGRREGPPPLRRWLRSRPRDQRPRPRPFVRQALPRVPLTRLDHRNQAAGTGSTDAEDPAHPSNEGYKTLQPSATDTDLARADLPPDGEQRRRIQ